MHPDDALFIRTIGALVVVYVALCVLAVAVGMFFVGRASAQDCETGAFGCGHHQNHDQYKDWRRPGGEGSCCSGEDCRPVRARPDGFGGWDIYIPEFRRWKAVPPAVIMKPDYFKDGRSHACTGNPKTWGFEDLPIYCFTPSEVKG